METSEKEIELEKEEEVFSAICHFELDQNQLLYIVNLYPDYQLTDYIVYLTKRVRPPRASVIV